VQSLWTPRARVTYQRLVVDVVVVVVVVRGEVVVTDTLILAR